MAPGRRALPVEMGRSAVADDGTGQGAAGRDRQGLVLRFRTGLLRAVVDIHMVRHHGGHNIRHQQNKQGLVGGAEIADGALFNVR